ncbi:MAG: hypothetical protein JSS69_08940 [Acidobacteria bacterium]|nr:hypothetical protein [Acidobacteriota bacterium]MBS1866030.1 hypothetical protein [Acidobacteriota bacterium]
MNANSRLRFFVLPATAFLLIFALGCKLGPSHERREEKSSASSAASKNSNDFDLNLNCVIESIQNPTESFHYTYKKDTDDDNLLQDADITPDTITGSSKNKYATREIKGAKSDKESWQSAWTGLMAISGMSSTIALVNHSSAMVREGMGKMNGYDAAQYSIDTSRGNTAEAGLYKATLGDGGFEKGTVWVNAKGCPVNLSLDSEMHLNNGSVSKQHYEIQMLKK